MIREVIILAGGKGTRLQSVISEVPKPMAPIGKIPFLQFYFEYLIQQGIERVVLSVGYKAEVISDYFGENYKSLTLVYAHETEPLGTGGGVRLAMEKVESDVVFVLNGDTFFNISLNRLSFLFNVDSEVCFMIALRAIYNNGRYGGVSLAENGIINGFESKNTIGDCLINAGVYLVNKAFFLENTRAGVFSMEDDFFAKIANNQAFKGISTAGYFIDIGIPEDYFRANDELDLELNRSFNTIFLDRDGVINQKIDGDYVRTKEDFVFNEGVLENFQRLNQQFEKVFVITNQRGISRGLFTEEALAETHAYLRTEVEKNGGKILKIYHCPCGNEPTCTCRKPKIGMADQLKSDFQSVDFQKTIMVGDSASDLAFGRNIGAKTVFITNRKKINFNESLFDEVFETFVDYLRTF